MSAPAHVSSAWLTARGVFHYVTIPGVGVTGISA